MMQRNYSESENLPNWPDNELQQHSGRVFTLQLCKQDLQISSMKCMVLPVFDPWWSFISFCAHVASIVCSTCPASSNDSLATRA